MEKLESDRLPINWGSRIISGLLGMLVVPSLMFELTRSKDKFTRRELMIYAGLGFLSGAVIPESISLQNGVQDALDNLTSPSEPAPEVIE